MTCKTFSPVHHSRQLRLLTSTVRNFHARLQLARRVHQAPFVFPFLTGLVELDFPRFVKRLEPEVLRAILQGWAYPVVHEFVHVVDGSDSASLWVGAGHVGPLVVGTVVATAGRPADFGNDLFLVGKMVCLADVVFLPVRVCPAGCFVDRDTTKEL